MYQCLCVVVLDLLSTLCNPKQSFQGADESPIVMEIL